VEGTWPALIEPRPASQAASTADGPALPEASPVLPLPPRRIRNLKVEVRWALAAGVAAAALVLGQFNVRQSDWLPLASASEDTTGAVIEADITPLPQLFEAQVREAAPAVPVPTAAVYTRAPDDGSNVRNAMTARSPAISVSRDAADPLPPDPVEALTPLASEEAVIQALPQAVPEPVVAAFADEQLLVVEAQEPVTEVVRSPSLVPVRFEVPVMPQRPNVPVMPDRPPMIPVVPVIPDVPSRPDVPVVPSRPELPDAPVRPERPERPDKPDRPDKPERPDRPERP